ncbi:hypothetical protein JQX13_06660 [Archangium violaceum]|uniref:hypothetical protein n=1 Tax=Archangium violaceum TaxID=83451 RepID=UPI00193B14DF|nr:hypothetical protein [Archangium violaceum]QRK09796.1 hypothetical protein JQX13_06660 [Archangium violaceum]
MKTAMMGSRGVGRFVWVLGALSLGLLGTGCTQECIDQFDCIAQRGTLPKGQEYVCQDNRCVERDVTDAGTGPTDGGNEPTDDAGTDAGVACADLPHDEKLGTLQLQTGYAAAESAALPEGLIAVTAIPSGAEFKLYGLSGGTDNSLYELGTWPNIVASTTPLQAVIPEADRGSSTYLSGFLANDGTRLLAGYTKSGPIENIPGSVLVYDTASPDKSSHVSANGNFSAVGVSGAFLFNGQGVEGSSEGGSGVYALKTGTPPFQGSKLATFPVDAPASGYTAATSQEIAVLGYSVPNPSGPFDPYINHLLAVAPATYTPALSGGTTLALTAENAPEIYAGSDLFAVAGFGQGVALHRGHYDASFNALTNDVSRIELTTGIEPKAVVVGELAPVLTTQNTCTNVVLMAPLGTNLLVGVKDKNGSRLVLVQKQ